MTKSIIKDYYSIISVPITACPDEIKRAYRKQALKLHPDKNKADCAEDKFKDLQEAYEVLSDPIKRKTYDLNRFNPTCLADLFKFPFNNNNNSRASNRNFNGHTPAARNNFGARNHRGGVFRRSPTSFTRSNYTPPPCFTTPPPMSRAPPQSAPPQQQQPPPPPPPPKQDDAILYDVKVNLEEICNGAIRKIRIEREVLGTDGILKKEEEVLPVEIKPGWKEGTKITYSKKGDIFPNRIPADIIFLIKEEQHSLFQRDGSTLRCSLNVPLCDALAGKVNVPNLGGLDFEINFGKPIQPGTVHCILGGGLPDRKNECKRGQLEVTFIVQLPERITPHVLRLAEATREFRKEDVTRWKRNAADEVKSWRRDDSTRGSNSNSN